MIDLVFPDGSVRQFPEGTSGRDVANSISPSHAKRDPADVARLLPAVRVSEL